MEKLGQLKPKLIVCVSFLGYASFASLESRREELGVIVSQTHSQKVEEVTKALGVNPERGLTDYEAAQRLVKYGRNALLQEHPIRFIDIFKEEVTEPMILLLLAVGVVYSILGNPLDAATIIVVIAILVLAEVWNEYRAKRSISALKQLAPPTALVLRDSQQVEIRTEFLVPGDILLLKVGQRMPADARLLEAFGLEVDESSLTGEAFPVSKDAALLLTTGTRVPDQTNMVFTGTVITRGRAKAVVTQTGLNSELGRISGLTKVSREPKTQLQLSMKQLSRMLVGVAIFFAILIPVLSYIRGLPGLQGNPGGAVLYGLSLAFVVIPEELPIIITMVLGVGSYALSRRGVIVKRLRAAETLGNVTVIATDKTGTLTENKLRVEHFCFDGTVCSTGQFSVNEKSALRTALLASDGILGLTATSKLGNPMAQAILERLKHDNADVSTLSSGWELKDELSFDVKRKLASYIYQYGNSQVVLSSGAPEKLLENANRILLRGEETPLTNDKKIEVEASVAEMAKQGERLLAFGYHRLSPDMGKKDAERDIVFVGVVGFIDPPRKEVQRAIQVCKEAGIRVLMITGDHPETARAIAAQVGINNAKVLTGNDIAEMPDQTLKDLLRETSVFARFTPEDKLRLVRLLKEDGEVVAVTGDGINDAPALKEAHIGVAMGIRGTDVAKEAADMILTDDNFATIEVAVSEGRRLYSNLRKGIRYYLACKVALVSIFLVPIVLGIPLPFAPIQIIVLELFMDLAASATFIAEPTESNAMKKPPISRRERFMNRTMLQILFLGALSLFVAVTVTYLFTWYTTQDVMYSRTVAFATWMFGHIFLAFNFRSDYEPLMKGGILSNKVMLLWALIAIVALVVGTSLLGTPLQITTLNLTDWVLAVGVAFVCTFWMELKKLL
ncbi:MAG: cation-translocating P-type ATPase [Betaproteobacteria bacterium]